MLRHEIRSILFAGLVTTLSVTVSPCIATAQSVAAQSTSSSVSPASPAFASALVQRPSEQVVRLPRPFPYVAPMSAAPVAPAPSVTPSGGAPPAIANVASSPTRPDGLRPPEPLPAPAGEAVGPALEPVWTPRADPACPALDGIPPSAMGQGINDSSPRVLPVSALTEKPIYDPEQPGNLNKYLEQVEGRLGKLEKHAATPPKLPFIQLSGFFQLDYGSFSQSDGSIEALGNIQNGVGFRRTRLSAVGKLSDFTGYSIEMDFATAGRPSFFDVWGEQQNLPFFGTIRIGQFRQPTTMDGWTSVRHLEFLERSIPFQALDPFRRPGIMAYSGTEDQRTTWAYSVYASGFTFWNPNLAGGANTQYATLGDTRFGTQIGDSGGVAGALRATHLLYYDEPSEGRYLLHIGGGYIYSNIGGSGPFAHTFDSLPAEEFFVGDVTGGGLTAAGTPPVLNTGRILANSFHFYHTELAANAGSASFQSEFMLTALNQMNGPSIFMPGAYAQCGYFLTGESVAYNRQAGVLDYNVVPYSDFFGLGKGRGFGGWGAWQIAARWSYVDLNCGNLLPQNQQITSNGSNPQNPNYGSVNETTIGLNWWWNRYTRVQFNWIHSMPVYRNNVPLAGSPTAPVFNGFAPFDVYGMRFQIEF